MVALHVSAVAFSYATGKNVLSRIAGPGGQFAMMLPYAVFVGTVAYHVNPAGVPPFPNWYKPPFTKKPEPLKAAPEPAAAAKPEEKKP